VRGISDHKSLSFETWSFDSDDKRVELQKAFQNFIFKNINFIKNSETDTNIPKLHKSAVLP